MDRKILKQNFHLIGVDEVGRGPIAGPVVACAVKIETSSLRFISKLKKLGVTDSKKLSPEKRLMILQELEVDILKLETKKLYKTTYFSFILTEEAPETIDRINILQASLLCMKRASDELLCERSWLLVDGNKTFESKAYVTEAVIGGDAKSLAIALASIIAKEFRDEKMKALAKIYPHYGFETHAGYPTKKHKEALEVLGVTPIHRRTYAPVKLLLERN